VAAGFEHSVANMDFLQYGLLVRSAGGPSFWEAIGETTADFAQLAVLGSMLNNLVPGALGNIVGGTGCVGAVYWFVYLRPRSTGP
jgi:formate transporter